MVKKVAICGTHQDTLNQAPFADEEWEIWGLAHRYHHLERMTLGFEIHNDEAIAAIGQDYVEWLKKPDIPVVRRKDFPMKEAIKLMGREYFASSMAFMMCKAILDGATDIGIFGVNLTDDEEYIYQKPNLEYLIGIAHGRGINIYIAQGSAICRSNFIYGDGVAMQNPLLKQYIKREQSCLMEIKRLERELEQLHGAKHEIQEIIKSLKDLER